MSIQGKPVIFERPENWDTMTTEEKLAYAGSIAEAMGFTDEGAAATTTEDPWVADLHSGFDAGECQSTVGFDDHPCDGTPEWYAQIEISQYQVANPQWEGKLCGPCLAGWRDWAGEEPENIKVLTVTPIAAEDDST